MTAYALDIDTTNLNCTLQRQIVDCRRKKKKKIIFHECHDFLSNIICSNGAKGSCDKLLAHSNRYGILFNISPTSILVK